VERRPVLTIVYREWQRVMRNLFTRKRLVLLSVVAVLAVTGSAIAYWTGGGTGSGTGTVGTNGTVVLTPTVTPGIAPGLSVPVSFTAANATGSPIQVTAVHLVSVAADAEHAACLTDDFSMANVTENHQVPGGASAEVLPVNGSLVYANTALSQDGCKGATLTLTLTSS
jgi:hypothetical protein